MINERDRSLICPSDYRQSSLLLRETIPAFFTITSTGNRSSGFHGISSQILGIYGDLAILTRPYLLRYSMVRLTDFRWAFLGDQAGDDEGAGWGYWFLMWELVFLGEEAARGGEPLINWQYTVESD